MVDISRVSQNVLNNLKTIEMQDGKKGITSASEREALAQMLANGEVTGGNNQEYIQSLIDNYDLQEAEKNASKDVKKAIQKAITLDGDKNTLTEREASVLNEIIDNTLGKYSAEDIQLAKMTKKTMGLSTSTPLGETQEENAALEARNNKLNSVIQEYQEKVNDLLDRIKELEAQLDVKEKELTDADSATKREITQLKTATKALKDVMLRQLDREKADLSNLPKLTEDTESIFAKAGKVLGTAVTSQITAGARKLAKGALD